MPYSLRKAPGRNKFWVVSQDGTHHSKEPLSKKKALAQMRALYAAEHKEGGSFEDWFNPIKDLNSSISKAIQDGYDEALTFSQKTWNKIKEVGDLDSSFWVTQHYPTAVEETLNKHKNLEVESIILRKAPVQAALEYALEAFSLGKWTDAKKKLGYDSMFHLSVLVNGKFVVEKLARININTPIDNPANAEFEVVKVTGKVTLGEMMEKTQKHMEGKFFPYDPFQNNCQDFVNGVMEANKDVFEYGTKQKEFVKQSVDNMIQDLPEFLPKFARTVTSLGGLTGGANGEIITPYELLDMCKESYELINGNEPKQTIGEWELMESTFTLLLYGKQNQYIVVARGTKEFRDVQAWKPIIDDKLTETARYKDDVNTLKQWVARNKYGVFYGTGHSLGGAICDAFLMDGLLNAGKVVSFNPAIETKVLKMTVGRLNNTRIYFQGDPLYTIFGKYDTKAIVVTDKEPGWMSWLTGVDIGSHSLENFEGMLDDVKLGGKKKIQDAELLAALEGGALLGRDAYEGARNTAPRDERKPGEINLGLRAIAHLDDDSLRRFGARVLADDIYELYNPKYDANSNETIGHQAQLRNAAREAIVSTRGEQRDQKSRVDNAMDVYNVERDDAYNLVLNPPKKVEKVKSKKEIQEEMEREAKLAREYQEARNKQEQDRIAKQMAAEEEAKALEEQRRKAHEEHERQLQEQLEAQRAIAKVAREEEDRLMKAAAEARAEAERLEAEKKKAREKEQEKARQKKKKGKKGSNVVSQEEEEVKERDPKLKEKDAEIERLESIVNKGFFKENIDKTTESFLRSLETMGFFIYIRGAEDFRELRRLADETKEKLNNRTSDYITELKVQIANTTAQIEEAKREQGTYALLSATVESERKRMVDYIKELEHARYNRMNLSMELEPPEEEFKQAAEDNLTEQYKEYKIRPLEYDLDYQRRVLKVLKKLLRETTAEKEELEQDEYNLFKKKSSVENHEKDVKKVEEYEKAVSKGDVSVTKEMTKEYKIAQDNLIFYDYRTKVMSRNKATVEAGIVKLTEGIEKLENITKKTEANIKTVRGGRKKTKRGGKGRSTIIQSYSQHYDNVLPEIKQRVIQDALHSLKNLTGKMNVIKDALSKGLSNEALGQMVAVGSLSGVLLPLLPAVFWAHAHQEEDAKLREALKDGIVDRTRELLARLNAMSQKEQQDWYAKNVQGRHPHSHVRDLGLPRPKHHMKETEKDKPAGKKPKPKKKEFGREKPSGKGRQHNAFQYSREDLTKEEKAAERARHYRKVKREKEGRYEVKPGQSRGLQYFNNAGERVEGTRGKIKKVELTEQEKQTEAARGLKPKKETRPKKDSERKAYVGSKMKEKFMAAGGNATQLKRAKRLYKEGNLSWEQVIQQVLH